MFSSFTSFLTSSISQLPFRLTSEEIVHPHQPGTGVAIWKHYQGVRVQAGVTGAMMTATGMGGGVSSDPSSASSGSSSSSSNTDLISIFTFDKKTGTADQLTLARNAILRLKTLRHPNILKFVDSVENTTHLHILTEQVQPLHLAKPIASSDTVGQLSASLGLYQLLTSLSFLNNEAKLVHSAIYPGSVYTTTSGDWKLSGLELCHKGTDNIPDAVLVGRNSGILPVQYRAPELTKNSSSQLPPTVIHAVDSWSLGCLIYAVFNANFTSPQQLAQVGSIPQTLLGDYKKLLSTNPANRLNPKQMLPDPSTSSSTFSSSSTNFFSNSLVSTVTFLDNLALQDNHAKDQFFISFSEHIHEFPESFCKWKILPLLTKSLDYGSGLTCFSAILQSILKIGSKMLTADEYTSQIIPSVVKLFSSNERSIRVYLLQHLNEYAGSLSADLINDQLFTHIQTGFSDSNPVLRELTVKSVMYYAGKLNTANMDLTLKWLGKLQTDSEPAIRTNTGYCLAKIASTLNPAVQERTLIPAFTKMLRDPFVPARIAGLTSLAATMELHNPKDVARKILPFVTPLLADDSHEVRTATMKLCESALRTMAAWSVQEKVRQDAAMTQNGGNAMGSAPAQDANALASGQAGAAVAALGSLSSWAVGAAVGAVKSKIGVVSPNDASQSSQQQRPTNTSSLNSSNTSSSYTSSTANNNNNNKPSSSSSSSSSVFSSKDDDDFFSDFGNSSKPGDNGEGGSDDDDGMTAVSLTSALSTKKAIGGAAKKDPKERKKSSATKEKTSILTAASVSASEKPSSSWDFDIDDSSSSKAGNDTLDDFGEWGNETSTTTTAALSTKPSSTKSSTSVASSSFDLLAAPSSTTHKKTLSTSSNSSSSSSADPFSALSISSPASSSSSATKSPMSLSHSKPKTSPIVAIKPATTSITSAGGKKDAKLDDWGDFLNS